VKQTLCPFAFALHKTTTIVLSDVEKVKGQGGTEPPGCVGAERCQEDTVSGKFGQVESPDGGIGLLPVGEVSDRFCSAFPRWGTAFPDRFFMEKGFLLAMKRQSRA